MECFLVQVEIRGNLGSQHMSMDRNAALNHRPSHPPACVHIEASGGTFRIRILQGFNFDVSMAEAEAFAMGRATSPLSDNWHGQVY